jgi:hypothetical protein
VIARVGKVSPQAAVQGSKFNRLLKNTVVQQNRTKDRRFVVR